MKHALRQPTHRWLTDEERTEREAQGRRIRLARERAEMTREELGRLVGVAGHTLNGYESGRTPIPPKRVRQAEKALGDLPPDPGPEAWSRNGDGRPPQPRVPPTWLEVELAYSMDRMRDPERANWIRGRSPTVRVTDADGCATPRMRGSG